MTDLHAALLARIEELEQTASATSFGALPELWTVRLVLPPISTGERGNAEVYDSEGDLLAEVGTVQDATHIAAWDPATVLRGLAEDRDILRRHTAGPWPNVEDGYDAPTCIGCGRDDTGDPRYLVPCPEVESLARRLGVEVES